MTALALDVGDRRIGLAVSDQTELVARPLRVLTRRSNADAIAEIDRIARETGARVIIVGLPTQPDGEIGEQAKKTLAFARQLRRHLAIELVTWDERLSTRDAWDEMEALGVRRARRRALLDAAAAAIILDDWLASRRSGGSATFPADAL